MRFTRELGRAEPERRGAKRTNLAPQQRGGMGRGRQLRGPARSWAGPASTRRQGFALDQRGRDGKGLAILGNGEDWDGDGEDRAALEEAGARPARCAAAKP